MSKIKKIPMSVVYSLLSEVNSLNHLTTQASADENHNDITEILLKVVLNTKALTLLLLLFVFALFFLKRLIKSMK
jgi:hypothetical protein